MDEWDRERWRGEIDSEIRSLKQTQRDMDVKFNEASKSHRELELKVQALATKLALYSALGACAGGGLVSVIVGLFFKH